MQRFATRLLVASAVLSFVCGGCGQPSAAPAPAMQVKMLTYNVHIGKGTDNKVDLARIARVIAASSPDIVALQEIDRGTGRSAGVDQFAQLVRLTGMKGVFCKTLDYDGGQFGIALLSRWEIVEHRFHRLPLEKGNEQRYLIEATVRAPAAAGAQQATLIKVLATHLDYGKDNPDRVAAAKFINRLISNQALPAILAGDFNEEADGGALKEMLRQWTLATPRDVQTFPANKPVETIDYILYRPADRFSVDKAMVIDEPIASDHRPVLAGLKLQP